ncbi:MAG: histidine phosphatase family protein [Phycisphaerales bacterium]|nr:histidine phosphatase family protein [Planctomycetota bacterium]MCH8509216.1 histidine phosphatase family protein [Phycisphaerales bacterium]
MGHDLSDRTDAALPPIGMDEPLISRRAALAMSGAVGLLGVGAKALGSNPEEERTPATVAFVLRHGETAEGTGTDPALSRRGRARAYRAGMLLRSVGAGRVMHPRSVRGRETAEEISRVLQTGIGSYDMMDPGPVIERILRGGGVWVLVGHATTVPDLVRRLGGSPGTDSLPSGVFDRMFMVVRAGGGALTVPLHVD